PRGAARRPAHRTAAAGGEVARLEPARRPRRRGRDHPWRRARRAHPRREHLHAHDRRAGHREERGMTSAVDNTREFPFSAEHFRVITDRIFRFSGIKLPEAKREMVYARLARRLRSLGLSSFDDYVRYLEAEPSEWEHCTNALTTNVTSFFREEHHFRVLAEHAQARAGKAGAYRVWSAGCSTGEEPYSIAMTLADTLHASNYHIVASDLDTQVLATARHRAQ